VDLDALPNRGPPYSVGCRNRAYSRGQQYMLRTCKKKPGSQAGLFLPLLRSAYHPPPATQMGSLAAAGAGSSQALVWRDRPLAGRGTSEATEDSPRPPGGANGKPGVGR
jgi:hypothetical protein